MENRLDIRAVLAMAAIAAACSGCAGTGGGESAADTGNDAAITMAIKSKFAADRQVAADAITVETSGGTVELGGVARTQDERWRAQQIAGGTDGVRAIRNDIVVRP